MCAQCFTSAEAVILNSAGLVAVVSGAAGALRDRVRHPASAEVRAQRRWDRSAASLLDLGFDPEATLGPRPGPPAVSAPAASRELVSVG